MASAMIGTPHRINIGQCVGRSDTAEVEGIIHDGHEKVGGRDDGLLIIQAINRRIVAGLRADQQVGKRHFFFCFTENFLQQGGGDFAAAAATVRQLGQFHFGHEFFLVQ
jgi:hypothetical protein